MNNPKPNPAFERWTSDNLVKFAQEAYDRLREQQEQIESLQRDVKTAMEAYRALLRQQDDGR